MTDSGVHCCSFRHSTRPSLLQFDSPTFANLNPLVCAARSATYLSLHSPSAALVATFPLTACKISFQTLGSAGPSAPRRGSLTSIMSARPAKAVSASAALRTLISRPVIVTCSLVLCWLLALDFGQSMVQLPHQIGRD